MYTHHIEHSPRAEEETEFKKFIDTLRAMGATYLINWGPTKEVWQKHLLDNGFNLTALACNVVAVGDMEFLFSSGQACWESKTHLGYGPSGVLLLVRNMRNHVTPRIYYDPMSGVLNNRITGLAAIKMRYPEYRWPE